MKAVDIFNEWIKGCGHTEVWGGADLEAWECYECTAGMVLALGRALVKEATEERIAFGDGTGLTAELAERFGTKVEDAVRSEVALVKAEIDNVTTANRALRVELHMAKTQLDGANGALTAQARGAGVTMHAHMNEVAELREQLNRERAQRADMGRSLDRLQAEVSRLGGGA